MVERLLRVMVVDTTRPRSCTVRWPGWPARRRTWWCAPRQPRWTSSRIWRRRLPDVVIVDLQLGRPTGIAASRRIRNRRPSTPGRPPDCGIRSGRPLRVDPGRRGVVPAQAGPRHGSGGDDPRRCRGARLLDLAHVQQAVGGRDEALLLRLAAEGRTTSSASWGSRSPSSAPARPPHGNARLVPAGRVASADDPHRH